MNIDQIIKNIDKNINNTEYYSENIKLIQQCENYLNNITFENIEITETNILKLYEELENLHEQIKTETNFNNLLNLFNKSQSIVQYLLNYN